MRYFGERCIREIDTWLPMGAKMFTAVTSLDAMGSGSTAGCE